MPQAKFLADEIALIDSVDRNVSSVRTRQLDLSFNELADMYETGELIIQPEYQRLFRWTSGAQSRFIETLILELPVPPIFLMETEENVYELIDGLQRISSYLNFRGKLAIDGKLQTPLELEDCDIIPELNGHTYESLPVSLVRRLKRNFIRAEILRKENDHRLRYYMFKRLNSGGESLEPQEIRNCTIRLLSPDFNDTLMSLAKNEDFKYCIGTVGEGPIEKKYDQELVLRFFAFLKWAEKYKHEVGDFLTDYMEAASDPGGARSDVFDPEVDVAKFAKTFKCLRIGAENSGIGNGQRIFGAVDVRGTIRGQFAVYHFEGFALGIQGIIDELDPEDADQMRRLGEVIGQIKRDSEVRKHTGGGKNTGPAFRARVAFFSEKLREVIG
ncbi:DUF262 domain-containing protein [Streptomyces sp. NPDC090301]|uniref:DUF262 domain-containing protein n=1 Tax=Streptomyces sp. NPDC090301 TaxID=3154975 RepID=UPI003425603D